MLPEDGDWVVPVEGEAPAVEPQQPDLFGQHPAQQQPQQAPQGDWVQPHEVGFWESLGNSAERGARSFYRNWQGLPGQLQGQAMAEDIQRRIAAGEDSVWTRRFIDNPELLETLRQQYAENAAQALPIVAEQNRRIQELPQHPAAEAMQRAQTWGEAWDHFTSAPLQVIANIGLESLVQQAPSLAAGAVAGGVGGLPALMATIGLGSAHTEYMGGIFSALSEEGVDITNPEALRAALLDQELMGRVRHRSAVKAGVVGLFDAGSAGLASRVLLPAATLASRPVARHLTNVGVQVPAQGAMGGAGEALGSVASGQDVSPGAVMGEIVGEAFGAPAEVAAARHARRPAPPTPPVGDWVVPAEPAVEPAAPTPLPSSGPQAAITGFYSPAERAVTDLPRKQGPAQAWFNDLKKRGVSDDELDWMGFSQWMEENKGRPISREEMAEFVRENGADLVEVRQDNSPLTESETRRADEAALDRYFAPFSEIHPNYQNRILADIRPRPQFASNFPAGTTNPRNFLVRLPGLNYESPHFGGPTVSFIRVADTVGPNGEKTLLVHGNQSELHQQAEKQGYSDEVSPNPRGWETTDGRPAFVPNAPLKGDRWWQLGLKLALRQAVAEGYDAVAISTAQQVAATDGNAPASLYDQKMPTWLGKYVKPMGGVVSRETGTGRAVVPITPKMRESISKGQPLFAGNGIETQTDADRYAGVERLLRLKRPNNVLPSIQTEVLETIENNPYAKMMPPDVDRAVLARIEPVAGAKIDQAVTAWFRTPDGETVGVKLPFRRLKKIRAFAISGTYTTTGRDLTGFLRLGRPAGGLGKFIAGEYRHEAVHILRNRNLLNGSVWFRLVDHALSLGVDRLSIRTAQQKMGDDSFIYTDPSATIEDVYREDLYAGYPNLDEMLDQEYVAYMLELHHHGYFSDADVAPVMDIIRDMEAGVYSGGGVMAGAEPAMAIAGERAKTASKGNLAQAQKMTQRGRNPNTIWEATGWGLDIDNKWKWEIDDSKAKLINLGAHLKPVAPSFWQGLLGKRFKGKRPRWATAKTRMGMSIKLPQLLQHPELYKAYPFLERLRINLAIGQDIDREALGGMMATTKDGSKTIIRPIRVIAATESEAISTLLHEIQHVIQRIEGFAPGASARPDNKELEVGGKSAATFSPDTLNARMSSGDNQGVIDMTRAEDIARSIRSEEERAEPNQAELNRLTNTLAELLRLRPTDYSSSAGETESRTVEERRSLTAAQRRERIPFGQRGDRTPIRQTNSFPTAADETARRAALMERLQEARQTPVLIGDNLYAHRVDDETVVYTDRSTPVLTANLGRFDSIIHENSALIGPYSSRSDDPLEQSRNWNSLTPERKAYIKRQVTRDVRSRNYDPIHAENLSKQDQAKYGMPRDLKDAHLDPPAWRDSAQFTEGEHLYSALEDAKRKLEQVSADGAAKVKQAEQYYERIKKSGAEAQDAWDALLRAQDEANNERLLVHDEINDIREQITLGPLNDMRLEYEALRKEAQELESVLPQMRADLAKENSAFRKAIAKLILRADAASTLSDAEEGATSFNQWENAHYHGWATEGEALATQLSPAIKMAEDRYRTVMNSVYGTQADGDYRATNGLIHEIEQRGGTVNYGRDRMPRYGKRRGTGTSGPMFAISGGPRIPSALSFIREHGGIKDENGELKAILDRPGRGSKGYLVGIVNNKTGVPLDRMRELMVEAGYIQRTPDNRPDETSIQDVLDIIRRIKDGEKVAPLGFEIELLNERDSAIASENRDQILREAEVILATHGMPYDLSETEEARLVELVEGGMAVDDALEQATIETINGRDESEAAAADSRGVAEDGGQAPEGEFGADRAGIESAPDDRAREARAEGGLPTAVTPPPIPVVPPPLPVRSAVPPPVPPGSTGGTGGRGGPPPGGFRPPSAGGGKPPGGGTAPLAIAGPSPIDGMPDGKLKRAFFKLQETFQDAEIRALKLVQRVEDARNVGRGGLSDDADPYLRMTLYHGRVGTKIQQGYDKVRELTDGMQALADQIGTNTLAVRKRINFYLHAQHATERNRIHGDGAAGMNNAYAARVLAAARRAPYFAEMKRLADMAEEINRSTLTLLADGRVISAELYGKLTDTYEHHVPLNRIFEGTEDVGGALSGRGFDVVGTGVKRAKGSDRDVDDIMTNIVANFEQAVLRSEKNIVDLATLKFMRENLGHMNGRIEITKPKVIGTTHEGLPITEQTSNPRILQLREDGKPVWIKFKDKELAVAFRGANKDTPPRIFRPVIAFTRLYAGLNTRFNPEFAFPNKLRDLQETLIHLSAQNKIGAKGALEALTTDMRQSLKDIVDYQRGLDTPGARLYQELKDRGGTTGGFGLSTREQVELHLSQIEKIAASPTRQNIEKFIEAVDAWNTIFEDSTRLSVYRTALNAGLSQDRAAAMAKEASINFNRQGTASPVVNGLWMFSNASIQGTTKMLRAMRNPKVATAVGLIVGLAVASAAEWNDWIDKDWRQKITKWDRLNSLNIMLPSPANGIHYISIPIAWGVKPIMVMANYAVDAARGEPVTLADMAKDVIAAMLQAYNPVGGTDITSAITPTILDVPVEIARNQKWSGAKIRPTTDQNAPADTQYFGTLKDTAGGRLAIGATRALQEHIGLAVSPADVHYGVEQHAGGAGRTVLRLGNLVAGVFSGDVPPAKEWPFISRFYKSLTDEEIGRSATRGPAMRAREALEEDSRRRFLLRDQADSIFRTMDGLSAQDAEARFNEILDTNQPLARELARIIQYRQAGLTATERRIIQMNVNDGSRARYLVENVLRGLTGEDLENKLAELRAKRIITNQVQQQVFSIMEDNVTPEPRNRRIRPPDWSRWQPNTQGRPAPAPQQAPPQGDWVVPQQQGDWVIPQ